MTRRRLAAAAVLAFLLAAAAVWALPVLTDLHGRAIGVLGDPDEYTWFLGWYRFAITAPVHPLLTDYLNYPAGVNLMWNTSDPLIAVLAAPLTAWIGPISTYNLLIPLAMAVSGWCAYFAARHFGAGVLAALAGGLLFEFSPYLLSQSRAHLSTSVAVFAPLLAIVLDEALRLRRRPAWQLGAAAGLLLAAQLLVLEEYVATGAVVAAVVAVVATGVALSARRSERLPVAYVTTAAAVAAAVFLVLDAWPLSVQFLGPHRPRAGTQFHEPGRFVIDLVNLVVPTSVEAFQPPGAAAAVAHITGTLYETSGYIGLPMLVACALVVWRGWSDLRLRVLGLATAAILVLSLGNRLHVGGHDTLIHLPWAVLNLLPLLGSALPARLSLYTTVGVVVLASLFVERWIVHGAGVARWAAAALAVLIALTWFPGAPPTFPQPVPAFFAGYGVTAIPAGSVALLAPWPREGVEQGMVWQAEAGMRFKMPQGYFLYADPTGAEHVGVVEGPLYDAMTGIENGLRSGEVGAEERQRLLAELRADRVQTVIVAPETAHEGEMVRFFTELLGRGPEALQDVLAWRGVSP